MMKLSILISFTLLVSLMGCKPKRPEIVRAPFSLTDATMERCEFTKAVVQEVRNELKLFGKIAADNNRLAQVYPVVSGNVLKINVELGDYVKQGQVLAVVRSSEVADFQRQLLDARSDAALAEKNLQVARELFSGKLNSERDVTAAVKGLEKSKAELDRINEVYSIYNLREGSIFNIIAPINGFIVSKDINRNEQLRSDKADVIFSIAQIDEVWILANVNESDISKVAVGFQAAIKTISYPDKIFNGKIDRVFNAIDPSTKAMKALVRISNTNLELKPEMNATITVSYSENKELVAVPSSAIIFDKSKNWVMVFKDRKTIETRLVEVYNQLGETTYLASGLTEGETVISKNCLLIYDAVND